MLPVWNVTLGDVWQVCKSDPHDGELTNDSAKLTGPPDVTLSQNSITCRLGWKQKLVGSFEKVILLGRFADPSQPSPSSHRTRTTFTMSAPLFRAATSTHSLARGFATSARTLAEAASSPPAPASAPRPRSSNPAQRSTQSGGGAADRLRTSQRNGGRPPRREGGQNSNRNGSGERRNKRLPSVFDAASASNQGRPDRGSNVKSLTRGSKKLPAPLPKTDWNSPLFSRPGFERSLAPAPRASSIFVPDLAAAAASSTSAPAGKGKGKAAAAPVKSATARLNLPGIKTAVNALKLHVRTRCTKHSRSRPQPNRRRCRLIGAQSTDTSTIFRGQLFG